jgi:hypothetical protein
VELLRIYRFCVHLKAADKPSECGFCATRAVLLEKGSFVNSAFYAKVWTDALGFAYIDGFATLD